jgi:hypothetical protein
VKVSANEFPVLREIMESRDLSVLVSQRLFERTPFLFDDNRDAYIEWKSTLAVRLEVDPSAILLVGSSALGFSLNPFKRLNPFQAESDVDVAVISGWHFDSAWRHMRNLRSALYRLPSVAQEVVKEHRSKYVYWGTIATDRILPHLPFGGLWGEALGDMSTKEPSNGRRISARLYRDFDALREYQLISFKELRQQLLEVQ